MPTEPDPYTETLRPVRATTAARLETSLRATITPAFNLSQGIAYTVGSRSYERDGQGNWFRVVKTRNPAYWDRDTAVVVCDADAPNPMPMLFFRFPMRETTAYANVKRTIIQAINRTVRARWGKSLQSEGVVFEGVEVSHWERTKLGPRFVLGAKGEFEPAG